ncbi:hypothetical protein [Natrinema salinisoli]|uniref:hypothetical protein n=1 Tax=Natrinema salinisoli TaxID=2878535 RepID=UPI001CF014F1|nr:hypothetical protein [Natrinema salinisoli]
MSDERSPPAATDEADAADDTESAGNPEPGGGPQRVVSEESVDDILESLDSTPAGPSGSASATGAEIPDSGPEATANDGPDDTGSSDPSTGSVESLDSSGAESAETAADEASEESDSSGTADSDPATVDSAAASLPNDASDASPEDLAARVEHGDVTGADVRAAEAGEGRESTPAIDAVELSLDDLETTRTGGTDTEEDWPDDAGPLAGSVESDTGTETSDGEDGSPGLLGRLKRFFSR